MVAPDAAAALLHKCTSVAQVKAIHEQIVASPRRYLHNLLVQTYARCGSLLDARLAFDTMATRKNVFSWTIIISAYVRADKGGEALHLFRCMNQAGDRPDEVTLAALLAACSATSDLCQGKMIHAVIIELRYSKRDNDKEAFKDDLVLGNSLVNMYAKCRDVAAAASIFDRMAERSVFSWTIMVTAFAQNGHFYQAVACYRRMRCDGVAPNAVTFVAVIAACSSSGDLSTGREVAAHVAAAGLGSHLVVGSALVNLYGKCGELDSAREIFEEMPEKNNVTWNGMIAAYVQSGAATTAMDLFLAMVERGVVPDAMAVSSILGACCSLERGRTIHSTIIQRRRDLQSDRAVCNALVHMYARCGSLPDAELVFAAIPGKNTVSWTTMIAALLAEDGREADALQLFREMDRDGVAASEITVSYALDACSRMSDQGLASGRALHAAMDCAGCVELLSSVEVVSSLLEMYASCGSLAEAEAVFLDRLPLLGSGSARKNSVVPWTNMMAAYVQHGQPRSSLPLARTMDLEGIKPDEIAFSTILGACTAVHDASLGRELHRRALELGYAAGAVVGNALVFMYGTWGRVDDAAQSFQAIKHIADANSFTAMAAAFARQGRTVEALSVFYEMNLHGVEPKDATFTSIFQACSHAGFLARALEHFVLIYEFEGMLPSAEHFGCVVDLLGRSGFVSEAEELVDSMPFEPDIVAWRSLLAKSRGRQAQRAAEETVQLQPSGCSSHYVLLSNLIKDKRECAVS